MLKIPLFSLSLSLSPWERAAVLGGHHTHLYIYTYFHIPVKRLVHFLAKISKSFFARQFLYVTHRPVAVGQLIRNGIEMSRKGESENEPTQ